MSKQLSCKDVMNFNKMFNGSKQTGTRTAQVVDGLPLVNSGIPNQGNTCYVASILQCLNVTDQLLIKLVNHRNQNMVIYNLEYFGLLNSYIRMVNEGSNATVDQFNILVNSFYKNFFDAQLNTQFVPFRQNCALEFFTSFINYIDKSFAEIELCKRGINSNDNYDRIYSEYAQQYNIFDQSFSFELKQQYICNQNTTHVKQLFDSQNILTLTFDSRENTLNDCFVKFFENEIVDDFQCNKCADMSSFTKKTTFYSTGEYLAIHLQRIRVNILY